MRTPNTPDTTINNAAALVWSGLNEVAETLGPILNNGTSILIPSSDNLNANSELYKQLSGMFCAGIAANIKVTQRAQRKTNIQKILHSIWSPVIAYEEELNNNTFGNYISSYTTERFGDDMYMRNLSLVSVYNALRLSILEITEDGNLEYFEDINKKVIRIIKDITNYTERVSKYLYIDKTTRDVKAKIRADVNKIFAGDGTDGKEVIRKMEQSGQIGIIPGGCIANLKLEFTRNAYVIAKTRTGHYCLIYNFDSSSNNFLVYDLTGTEKYYKYTESDITDEFGSPFKFIFVRAVGTNANYALSNTEEYRNQVNEHGKGCFTDPNITPLEQTQRFTVNSNPIPKPDIPTAIVKVSETDSIKLAKGWLENVLGLRYIWGGGHIANSYPESYRRTNRNNQNMMYRGYTAGTTNVTNITNIEMHEGFDCSGGILYIISDIMGLQLNDLGNTDYFYNKLVIQNKLSESNIKTGDIALYGSPSARAQHKYSHIFLFFHSNDIQPGGSYKASTDAPGLYIMNATGDACRNRDKTIDHQAIPISYGINEIKPWSALSSPYKANCEFYRIDWDKIRRRDT